MSDKRDFTGQVAVVVGAGNGIGRASLGLLLARGARVIAIDNNQDALSRVQAEFSLHDDQIFQLDVSDENKVREIIAAIFGAEKRIDALVNTAGMTGPTNRK